MHRALSTENLAYFAQTTLHSLRRIISSSSDEGDLSSLTKLAEERCMSGYALDAPKTVQWASMFYAELNAIAHPRGGGGVHNTTNTTAVAAAYKDPNAAPTPTNKAGGESPTDPDSANASSSQRFPPTPPSETTAASGGGRPPLGGAGGGSASLVGSQREGSAPNNSNGNSGATSAGGGKKTHQIKAASEAQLLAALDCMKLVYRVYTNEAIALFTEHNLFIALFEVLHSSYSTRKLNDAISTTLVSFMAERNTPIFGDLCEIITNMIASVEATVVDNSPCCTTTTTTTTILPATFVPTMRCLLLVYNALKRADLVDVEHSNGVKSQLVEMGAMRSLLRIAKKMKSVIEECAVNAAASAAGAGGTTASSVKQQHGTTTPTTASLAATALPEDNPQVAFAVGILCMALLGGLTRSNVPNKEELRKEPLTFVLWTFYASLVGKMECAFSYMLDASEFSDHSNNHHNHGNGNAHGGGIYHPFGRGNSNNLLNSPTTAAAGGPPSSSSAIAIKRRGELGGSNSNLHGDVGGSLPSNSSVGLTASNNTHSTATSINTIASNNGNMFAPAPPTPPTAPLTTRITEKQQVLTLDPAASWAGELVEFITELCTSDSFALNRQSLYAAQDDAAGIHSHQDSVKVLAGGSATMRGGGALSGMGVVAGSAAKRTTHHQSGKGATAAAAAAHAIDPFAAVRKWEVLPMNWDALVSDSVFIWRMVTAASVCLLTTESASQLLEALVALDLNAPLTDFVFRAAISNLIILFRASPENAKAIVEADTFRHIITTMTSDTSVLVFEDLPIKPRASVKLGHQSWPISMALLTVIIHTAPRRAEICVLMNAVSDMSTHDTSAEDCEMIEHLLQVLASSTYPPKQLWFSADSASIICPVDKFAGRWYGYTFMGWVNPLCIWQGGSHLLSWSDPSGPSSVVISIVANGRKKCLSVCHTAGQETSVSLLTETTFQDGWNHIAIVHNISGFVVFINGQKRSNGVNVPFPKEPSKPHRLCFHFGGSNGELGVKPFFGLMTQPQLMDGAVPDKDIERLAAAGPGSNATSVDPHLTILPFLSIEESITGPLALPDCAEVRDVFILKGENVADILQEEDVLDWFISSILNASQYINRNSVAILCLEMLIAYARLVPNGISHIYDKGVVLALSKEVLTWESVPYHLPPVVIGLIQPTADSRRLLNHPITQQVLTFLLDIVAQPNCPPLTRNQIFRDLSSLLGDEHNIKLFRDGPSLTGVLSVCPILQRECTDDCVILIEKLIRESSEMDAVLKFLVFEPKLQLMKCDILRMIYEVGQSDQLMLDALAAANAVPMLIYIIGDTTHQSENLRAYAIRLLALVLIMNRKQRDVFLRIGGFDTFGAAMNQKRVNAYPLKLTTFNFLFKFALGFFQPMEFSKDGLSRQQSAATVAAPSRPLLQPSSHAAAMNGHLPSLIPQRDVSRRQISMDLASLHSDPDARLTIDDTYNSQTHSSKTELLYPQLLQIIYALLPFAVESASMSTGVSQQQSNSFSIRKNATNGRENNTTTSANNAIAATPPIPPITVVSGMGAALGSTTGSGGSNNGHSTPHSPLEGIAGGSGNGGVANNGGSGRNHQPPRGGSGGNNNSNNNVINGGGGANRSTTSAPVSFNSNRQSSDHFGPPTPRAYNSGVMGQSVDAVSDCGSGSTTARREEDTFATILKVLAFADRVFDISRNADIVLALPWMEWLWAGVAPFLEGAISTPPALCQSMEHSTRSIIRKICLADLIKPRSGSYIKRIKDLTEMPTMQRMVVEEVLRHFSTNNRLDGLQQEEATNVLRNLDSLLLGIEESISPFPLHLGMEVATALAAITVHNNTWVRTRVKNNTKLLETRDRLCFMMLSGGWKDFRRTPFEQLYKVLRVNAHDPNATLLVLRFITEAVTSRCVESTETLQSMLQQLHHLDPEQKRILSRVISDDEVVIILLTPNTNVLSGATSGADGSTTEGLPASSNTAAAGEGNVVVSTGSAPSTAAGGAANTSATAAATTANATAATITATSTTATTTTTTNNSNATQFIQWCIAEGGGKWEQIAAKILKASKALDETIRSQAERAQKEFTVRVKARKAEIERKAVLQTRSTADYERLVAEVETKRAPYTDAIEKAHSRRRERDEKRQSMMNRTSSTYSNNNNNAVATAAGGGSVVSSSSVTETSSTQSGNVSRHSKQASRTGAE